MSKGAESRGPTATAIARPLADFEQVVHRMACEEQLDGWLGKCERTGEYLVPNRQLVERLAAFLRGLSTRPIVEVCAGSGRLARALRQFGVEITPVDSNPACGPAVVIATAADALRRFRPAVVLGCFVPVDSGVDAQVMQFPTVEHYVVLGARLGGVFGSMALWESGWRAEPLEMLTRYMTTRHDVYLGMPHKTILQHGEAWYFQRPGGPDHIPYGRCS